jgi:hypothetical protein
LRDNELCGKASSGAEREEMEGEKIKLQNSKGITLKMRRKFQYRNTATDVLYLQLDA